MLFAEEEEVDMEVVVADMLVVVVLVAEAVEVVVAEEHLKDHPPNLQDRGGMART